VHVVTLALSGRRTVVFNVSHQISRLPCLCKKNDNIRWLRAILDGIDCACKGMTSRPITGEPSGYFLTTFSKESTSLVISLILHSLWLSQQTTFSDALCVTIPHSHIAGILKPIHRLRETRKIRNIYLLFSVFRQFNFIRKLERRRILVYEFHFNIIYIICIYIYIALCGDLLGCW